MIMDPDADFIVGTVVPQFRVRNMHGNEIALVSSPAEAVKALEQWDADNPPQWERCGRDEYEKATRYGVLLVERQSPGASWLVFRDDGPMVSGTGRVRFRALQDAKRAADAHLRDGYPGATPPGDGRWWLDQNDPLEGARAERRMIATGNLEGDLVELELNYAPSQEEERAARELAATWVLERAIGLALADMISVMYRANKLAEHGLPAKEIVAVDLAGRMERLVDLAKLANSRGVSCVQAMMRNGKHVLKERYGKDLEDREASLLVEEVGIWLVKWLGGDPRPLRDCAPNEQA